MKKFVCEMCNSNELVKRDGLIVCQYCGMKYSIEEVRRMMIEGVVNVQGTVKVDNSLYIEKCLANARRARKKEDWDEVEKYYNMVEQNVPDNIEAIFYSAYGKAKASLTNGDIFKRQAVFKALRNSISILDDNYNVNNSKNCNAIMDQIVNDVIGIYRSDFVYTEKTDGYGFKSNNAKETYILFEGLGTEMYVTLENIAVKIPMEQRQDILFVRKLQYRIADFMATGAFVLDQNTLKQNRGRAKRVLEEIKVLDKSFVGRDYDELDKKEKEIAKKKKRKSCLVSVLIVPLISALAILLMIIAIVIASN